MYIQIRSAQHIPINMGIATFYLRKEQNFHELLLSPRISKKKKEKKGLF